MPFGGQLSLDEDERPLKADVDFVGSDLILSTPAGLIGRWPLDSCRIQPDNGRFLITVDGERPGSFPTNRMSSPASCLSIGGVDPDVGCEGRPGRRRAAPTLPMEPEPAGAAERTSSFAEVLTGLDGKTKRRIATAVIGLVLVLLDCKHDRRPTRFPVGARHGPDDHHDSGHPVRLSDRARSGGTHVERCRQRPGSRCVPARGDHGQPAADPAVGRPRPVRDRESGLGNRPQPHGFGRAGPGR